MLEEMMKTRAIAFVGRCLAGAILALVASLAQAAVGVMEIPGKDGDRVVTVFYPSSGQEAQVKRGPFAIQLAENGAPIRGNGRLIILSHGSGGSVWVHGDLAKMLSEAGFIVAGPEHAGDNYRDKDKPGPDSWKRRPQEVSRAIDAVAADARFGPLLNLDKVGMYGMSAGGHTALSLAGGRWSPALMKAHCEAHIAEDFQSCVGLATSLSGGIFDGLKKTVAMWMIRAKLDDTAWYSHTDPRIAAIVAGVPYAADFDTASLAAPKVALGLVTARQDKWLIPRFHSDPVLAACAKCERVADLATGGHGALLSPAPPKLDGLVGELLNDPPGFDRAREVPEVNRKIASFFVQHLAK
jgi:predicted dienelactone hydrolase